MIDDVSVKFFTCLYIGSIRILQINKRIFIDIKQKEKELSNKREKIKKVKNDLEADKKNFEKLEEEIKSEFGSVQACRDELHILEQDKEKIEKNFCYPNSFSGQHSLFS